MSEPFMNTKRILLANFYDLDSFEGDTIYIHRYINRCIRTDIHMLVHI